MLNNKVAKLFYACNIPFSVLEHPLFVDMVESLRPGFTSHSRKAIGGHLLDEVTEEVTGLMKHQ